jgi:aldehyde dehydrogenase (NAD+)
VMAAAARHLASVTLELGGKCPVIIDGSADLDKAARDVALAKHNNAGQLCLTADHVWVHQDVRDEFLELYRRRVERNLFAGSSFDPRALGKIVDDRNVARLTAHLDDARSRGATVLSFGSDDTASRVLAPTVVLDPPLDSTLMRDEIFGPILPVLTFTDIDDVVTHLQEQDKPLALYLYSTDPEVVDAIRQGTSSGGLTVNGWALHYFDSRLPFGGVGNSGLGRYHSVHGFREVSHERAVVIADSSKLAPPAGGAAT